MSVSVRQAELADAQDIAEIHVRTWQIAYRGILPDAVLDSRDVGEFAARWNKNLATQAPASRLNWVALRDGIIEGFCSAGRCRDDDADKDAVGEIYAIYVHPRAWSIGAGRLLFDCALEFLRERGFREATLWVLTDNPRARRFYEIAGMKPDGATKIDNRIGCEMRETRYRMPLIDNAGRAGPAPTGDNMFDRFSHVMMYVKDLARAVNWYKQKLGFTENFVHLPHYASLRHDKMKCRVDLHPSEANSKDVGFGPLPYFAAKDFDGALAKLKKAGVKTGEPRKEGDSPRFVSFWDSEGNALGLEELR